MYGFLVSLCLLMPVVYLLHMLASVKSVKIGENCKQSPAYRRVDPVTDRTAVILT